MELYPAIGKPRASYGGTYDEKWEKTQNPFLPKDFDIKYYQHAPEDQQIKGYLKGGEQVNLKNLHPDGDLTFKLPKLRINCLTVIDKTDIEHRPNLHTVITNPDDFIAPARHWGDIGAATAPNLINLVKDKDLVDGSTTVDADGGNSIAIKGCKFSKSIGDEPGTDKGVSSGTQLDEAKFISFSPDVTVEGQPVARLSDKMLMNKENSACMGGIVIPPVTRGEILESEYEDFEGDSEPISIYFEVNNPDSSREFTDCKLKLISSDDEGGTYNQQVSLKTGGDQVVEKENGMYHVIFHEVPSGKNYTCTMHFENAAKAEGSGRMILLLKDRFIGKSFQIEED